MKIILSSILFTLLIGNVKAQDSLAHQKSFKYFFNFSNGALFGPAPSSVTYTLSTVHGVVYGKWRAGVGLGFDTYYNWQAVPFFGQVSYDLLGEKNVLFVQGSYGWSTAWLIQPEGYGRMSDDQGGTTFGSMLGYRIKSGNLAVTVSAGYKYQHVSNKNSYLYYYDIWPGGSGNESVVEQNFERFVLTLGVGWR